MIPKVLAEKRAAQEGVRWPHWGGPFSAGNNSAKELIRERFVSYAAAPSSGGGGFLL